MIICTSSSYCSLPIASMFLDHHFYDNPWADPRVIHRVPVNPPSIYTAFCLATSEEKSSIVSK